MADRGRGPALNPQARAARVLTAVAQQGRHLDAALDEEFAALPAAGSRGLVQEMAYGTLRLWLRLDALARHYLSRPLKDKDADIRALLLLGLYQLAEMRAPQHATVAETVEAAALLGKPWAKGLLNACLRGFLRDPAGAEANLADDEEARYCHPRWLIEALRTAWPEDWARIVEANNRRPPLTLRVNLQRLPRAEYLARLRAEGIEAGEASCTGAGVTLTRPQPVESLPGFAQGLVSVQDAAAQLAAEWLAPVAGERVLDACAAPGGKSAHLLEHCPGIHLTALDIDPARAARIGQNLSRLGLAAHVVTGDALAPAGWWDGESFDRVLLDAPCSASGVIRRHPDIKLHRRPADLARLADIQGRLLETLWPLLKRGGKLLYATCSILPDENERRIAAFRAHHADAESLALPPGPGRERAPGRQLLPGEHCGEDVDMDGFYYALLQKK